MSNTVWVPSWQADDVEIKEDNLIYNGFFNIKSLSLRYKCFSGEWSPWLIREQIRRVDAAAVLLIDPEKDKLILVEQIRIGLVGTTAASPWMLEIVAGLIEPHESAAQTIVREAQEEAGCDIAHLFPIGEFYNTPGGFSEKTTLFCGVVNSAALKKAQGAVDEHEDIRVHVLSTQAVLEAFEKGLLLTSASTVIALSWLINNRQKDCFKQN